MKLENARILTIVSDDYDDLELWYPMIRLREEGAKVDVAGEKAKQVYVGKSGLKVESDLSFKDVENIHNNGAIIAIDPIANAKNIRKLLIFFFFVFVNGLTSTLFI